MKSIMEQASSITKAIEKAWNRAGNPEEFSIKVFEAEEKNFFGMTTKPAKVGIFFTEKPPASPAQKDKPAPGETQREKPKAKPQQVAKEQPIAKRPTQQTPVSKEKKEISQEAKPRRAERPQVAWNNEMVAYAQSWIKTSLSLMELPNIEFSTEVKGKNLKLTFESPVLENHMDEAQLFRCFAHLIISTLQNQFKQELRNLRIILVRP